MILYYITPNLTHNGKFITSTSDSDKNISLGENMYGVEVSETVLGAISSLNGLGYNLDSIKNNGTNIFKLYTIDTDLLGIPEDSIIKSGALVNKYKIVDAIPKRKHWITKPFNCETSKLVTVEDIVLDKVSCYNTKIEILGITQIVKSATVKELKNSSKIQVYDGTLITGVQGNITVTFDGNILNRLVPYIESFTKGHSHKQRMIFIDIKEEKVTKFHDKYQSDDGVTILENATTYTNLVNVHFLLESDYRICVKHSDGTFREYDKYWDISKKYDEVLILPK